MICFKQIFIHHKIHIYKIHILLCYAELQKKGGLSGSYAVSSFSCCPLENLASCFCNLFYLKTCGSVFSSMSQNETSGYMFCSMFYNETHSRVFCWGFKCLFSKENKAAYFALFSPWFLFQFQIQPK